MIVMNDASFASLQDDRTVPDLAGNRGGQTTGHSGPRIVRPVGNPLPGSMPQMDLLCRDGVDKAELSGR